MRSKTSKTTVREHERRKEALSLRRGGANYTQIGAALGVTRQAAHRLVSRELARLAKECSESAKDIRAVEVERLDAMLLGLWPQARSGHGGAVDRVLRVMERRAKLLGLDAPAPIADAPAPIAVTVRHVTEDDVTAATEGPPDGVGL